MSRAVDADIVADTAGVGHLSLDDTIYMPLCRCQRWLLELSSHLRLRALGASTCLICVAIAGGWRPRHARSLS